MIDFVRDMILAASGVLVLLVLNRANAGKKRVPDRVWPFLLVGFSLLLVGRVLEMVPAASIMLTPLTKGVLQEVVGFCLGFLVLAIGLLRWLPEVLGTKSGQQPVASPITTTVPATRHEHSAQEMLTSVLKSSLSGVMVVKAVRDDGNEIVDFECMLMNEAAQQILGRSATNMVGRAVLKEFSCIRSENLLGNMVSVIETGLPYRHERHFNHDRNGRWYQFVAVKLGDGLAVTFGDVSDRKRAEDQLRHAAHHDALTGLPNRALLTERLAQAINRAKRYSDYKFAVLFLDFDRFKIINDTLGHDAGDQLLIGIAERLRSNLRAIDTSSRVGDGHLPARLGGDEFVVLLENVAQVQDAVRVAERLQTELSSPHNLGGHEVVSTASIGIVTSDLGYESSDDIIRDADTAMYQAKMSGKARHVVFDGQMHEEVADRARLERELRTAVDDLAFELAFDPIVNLETGGLAGFEVLVRWPHSTHGTLEASEFLPLAEEIGLVVPIGQWVLEQACAQLKAWQDEYPARDGLVVNVNLSRQQFQHPELVSTIERAVAETGIAPGSLRLEITEGMLRDTAEVMPIFERLDELGVWVVMDEFGSGHSSLSCLHRFPIDLLKIDGDFIRSVRRRRDYGAIVNAVVELAHNLGMQVVVAGVDAPDQVALLQALECDFAQGPVFSPALSVDEVPATLGADARFKIAA